VQDFHIHAFIEAEFAQALRRAGIQPGAINGGDQRHFAHGQRVDRAMKGFIGQADGPVAESCEPLSILQAGRQR
jgi:hypothetical protein